MDTIVATGMAHIFGVLGWFGAVFILSLKLLSQRGGVNADLPPKGKHGNTLLAFLLLGGLWVSLSGLFYNYEQLALEADFKSEFWWVHSMLLAWIFYTVVIFLLDPLVFKRN